MKIITVITLLGMAFIILISALPCRGYMSSESFQIPYDTFDGGGAKSMSESFQLIDSIGQSTPVGSSQSEGFRSESGFIPQLPSIMKGDFDKDGDVDGKDLRAFAIAFELNDSQADLNNDEEIGDLDLEIFAYNFGKN